MDRLPMNETVMGIWSCLVRLAGNSALPSRDQSSLFQPPSSKKTPKASLPAVPEDGGAAASKDAHSRVFECTADFVHSEYSLSSVACLSFQRRVSTFHSFAKNR